MEYDAPFITKERLLTKVRRLRPQLLTIAGNTLRVSGQDPFIKNPYRSVMRNLTDLEGWIRSSYKLPVEVPDHIFEKYKSINDARLELLDKGLKPPKGEFDYRFFDCFYNRNRYFYPSEKLPRNLQDLATRAMDLQGPFPSYLRNPGFNIESYNTIKKRFDMLHAEISGNFAILGLGDYIDYGQSVNGGIFDQKVEIYIRNREKLKEWGFPAIPEGSSSIKFYKAPLEQYLSLRDSRDDVRRHLVLLRSATRPYDPFDTSMSDLRKIEVRKYVNTISEYYDQLHNVLRHLVPYM